MRIIISILTLAMWGLPASAKSKPARATKNKAAAVRPSSFTGAILSYEALARLPKAKRIKYLRQTIDLLATMESFNRKYTVAENSRLQEYREQVATLMQTIQFLPEALAEEGANYQPAEIAKITPYWQQDEWTCGAGAEFDSVVGACLVTNAAGQTAFAKPESTGDGAAGCPAGSHAVAHYHAGSVGCVPEANWRQIPASRKSTLEGKTNSIFDISKKMAPSQTFEQQSLFITGRSLGTTSSPETTGSISSPGSSTSPTTPGAPAAASDSVVADGRDEPNSDGAAATDPPAAEPTEKVADVAPEKVAAPAAPAEDKPATEPADAKTPPPSAAKNCEPPAPVCKKLSAAERENAIVRYSATEKTDGQDANVCIAGGFLSKYTTSKKSAGTCEIKRSMKIGLNKTTEPCAADEALCNPVLFCLQQKNPSGKPAQVTFCVKKIGDRLNRSITDSCATTYSQLLEKKFKCKKMKGQSAAIKAANERCAQMEKIKGEACDPTTITPVSAVGRKEWEEIKAGLEKLRSVWCGNKEFASLFCRECEIVNAKIKEMNKDATGSGCGEPATPAPAAPVKETTAPAAPPQEPRAVRDGVPQCTDPGADQENCR